MNKINQFLKKDSVQRICYVVLLILWIWIFLRADLREHIISDADYLPLAFIIPVILLVLQILFNNRKLGMVILTGSIALALWTVVKL